MKRREFLAGAASAAAAFTMIPRDVFAGRFSPSARPVLACVGIGGVGHNQIQSCEQAGFQVDVLCDVDDVYAKRTYDRYPKARRYRDFREMLATEGDKIDAVYCGTPDHTHAIIVLDALKRGKHVCCVKPLTRTIRESRILEKATIKARVSTQVTASPCTTETGCRTCELIWAGMIGDVTDVHIWTNRPLWPQGMTRPPGEDPVPKTLDWDLWLGPAPARPFKDKWPSDAVALGQIKAFKKRGRAVPAVYHPWNFRGWWDFGTGALGDMGCHYLNTPKRALKLGHPTNVHATATMVMEETAPLASIVTWDFPAREGMCPVRLHWYDGGVKPPTPRELPGGEDLPSGGALYIGTKGKMLGPRILAGGGKDKPEPPKTLPRRPGTWGEWFEAVRGGEPAGCHFGWAAPLTELVLLGNIAIRTGKRLAWDGKEMRFTNCEEANRYLNEPSRAGWALET